MAVPVIIAVAPSTGPAHGRNMIRVWGRNFRLPDAPPTSGRVATSPVTVRVRFDGEAALLVEPVNEFELRVRVPPYRGAAQVTPIPASAVEVTNLTNTGAPIAGETVTAAAAYTYARPALRAPAAEPTFVQVFRELGLLLQRTVLANTGYVAHPDYAEGAPTPNTLFAALPALAISEPAWAEDRERDADELFRVQSAGTLLRHINWRTSVYRLSATVTGVSDNAIEALSLGAALTETVDRTPYLFLDDPTYGRQRYPLELAEPPSYGRVVTTAPLHSFAAELQVLDVPLEPVYPHALVEQAVHAWIQTQNFDLRAAPEGLSAPLQGSP